MEPVEHTDVHDCDHDCTCFWCRVSRREPFPTIEEGFEIAVKRGHTDD